MTWAYHATNKKHLPSITKAGLVPQIRPHEHEDEERGIDGPVIFFSPRPGLTRLWGDTVLRFPWPEDAQEDPYGEAFLDEDGLVNHTNWYTENAIAPEDLQVYDGMWRALPMSRQNRSPRERQPRHESRVRAHPRRVR